MRREKQFRPPEWSRSWLNEQTSHADFAQSPYRPASNAGIYAGEAVRECDGCNIPKTHSVLPRAR